MSALPLAAVKRIIKREGNLRVSDESVVVLTEKLEDTGLEISALALKFTKAAGRVTVTAEDIENAVSILDA